MFTLIFKILFYIILYSNPLGKCIYDYNLPMKINVLQCLFCVTSTGQKCSFNFCFQHVHVAFLEDLFVATLLLYCELRIPNWTRWFFHTSYYYALTVWRLQSHVFSHIFSEIYSKSSLFHWNVFWPIVTCVQFFRSINFFKAVCLEEILHFRVFLCLSGISLRKSRSNYWMILF